MKPLVHSLSCDINKSFLEKGLANRDFSFVSFIKFQVLYDSNFGPSSHEPIFTTTATF